MSDAPAPTAVAARDRHELVAGTLVNARYEIRETLGEGGFGRVYLAYDREMDREVAIKVLEVGWLARNDQPVDTMLVRFRREAMIAGKIRHPAVVEVYDVGTLRDYDDNPYMIMERLEGEDLEVTVERHGPLRAERLLPLFCDALEGLGQVHAMGIVHKDLKPANLFLCRAAGTHERLKIVDFGVARVLEGAHTRLTRTGQVLGTPQYMAPEYFELGDVTPAVDVYQMALILVEALGGKPVVSGDSPRQCLLNHVQGLLTAPIGLLVGPLGPILQRALQKDPAARYRDAGEFAAALREVDPSQVAVLLTQKRHHSLAPVHMSIDEMRTALGSGALLTLESLQRSVIPAPDPALLPGPLAKLPRNVALGLIALGAAFATSIVMLGLVLLFVLPGARDAASPPPAPPPAPAADPGAARIDTIPPGATIYSRGKRVGKAPVTIPIRDPHDTRLEITARHPGYRDATLRLRGQGAANLEIILLPE